LSDSQRARLDAEMELATDGTATLLHDHLGEHRAGPAETMAGLSAALDAARGAGPADSGSGYRPDEEAEIEAHLEQLGYL
jgi:hypothetical protein